MTEYKIEIIIKSNNPQISEDDISSNIEHKLYSMMDGDDGLTSKFDTFTLECNEINNHYRD